VRHSKLVMFGVVVTCVLAFGAPTRAEEMPAQITIQQTDSGPVFADRNGLTLYQIAVGVRREGGPCGDFIEGKGPNRSAASKDMNLSFRGDATCADKFPIPAADDAAKPIGKWTISQRQDGRKQWNYNGRPLFRSVKDAVPGDVNGAVGEPAYVERPLIPGVQLARNGYGQYLVTTTGMSLYTYDKDRRDNSACEGVCSETWLPFLTGSLVTARLPDWSVVTRKDNTRQWAYKGKPLYTNVNDIYAGHRKGEDTPNWRIARVSPAEARPPEIAIRMTWLGEVYADASNGHSIYTFSCNLAVPCDDPSDSTSYWNYWVSFCGAPEQCAKMFRPVLAPKNAQSKNRTWTVVKIKAPWAPVRLADNAQDEGISVWAYRGRPVFTFDGDDRPGEFNAIGLQRSAGGEENANKGSFRWTALGPWGPVDPKTDL